MNNVSGWLSNLLGPVELRDEGVAVPSRLAIDFVGTGVTLTDDAAGNRTIVTVASGGLGSGANTSTGTIALTGAGSWLSVGVNPAGSGIIRIPNNATIRARNAANSGDVALVNLSGADTLTLGGSGVQATVVQAAGTQGFFDGSNYSWLCNFGGVNASGLPIQGLSVPQGSVNGVGVQAMADTNQTAAAGVYEKRIIRTTGALTANRTLTLPAVASDAAAYEKIIDNQCTGAFSVVISVGAGTTITIANARRAVIFVDTSGVRRVSADQT